MAFLQNFLILLWQNVDYSAFVLLTYETSINATTPRAYLFNNFSRTERFYHNKPTTTKRASSTTTIGTSVLQIVFCANMALLLRL